jgi:hypothetical protein
MELDCPPRLAEVRPGIAQISKILPLPAPVTDLPRNLQRLFVELDCAPRLAEVSPRAAQIPQCVPSRRRSPSVRLPSSCAFSQPIQTNGERRRVSSKPPASGNSTQNMVAA